MHTCPHCPGPATPSLMWVTRWRMTLQQGLNPPFLKSDLTREQPRAGLVWSSGLPCELWILMKRNSLKRKTSERQIGKGKWNINTVAPSTLWFLRSIWGTSPHVQWLRLHLSKAGGVGLIPGRETKIPRAGWRGPKKKMIYLTRWDPSPFPLVFQKKCLGTGVVFTVIFLYSCFSSEKHCWRSESCNC